MQWQTGLSELIRAVAYGLCALTLAGLFTDRQTAWLGARRWLLVAMLGVFSAVQFALFSGWTAGFSGLNGDATLISAFCLLLVAICLWPIMRALKRRLGRAMDDHLQRRLQRAEAQALQAHAGLLLAEEIAHVGHWRIDLPDYKLTWSDEIFRIHGLPRGRHMPDMTTAIAAFHPDDREMIRARIEDSLLRKANYEWEARLVRPDGEIRNVLSRGVLQYGEAGAVTGLFGVFLDLTEQKRIEEKLHQANMASEKANQSLRELAMVDALTGLPNRRHFDAALDTEFKRARRETAALAVIMVDLDYFKAYNDVYGHPAGDDCLRRVATAIAAVPKRPGDLVARYGGEEFVILLPGADETGAEALAARLVSTVRALELEHRGGAGQVTISCGVAVFHSGDDRASPVALLQWADRALYKAKHSGRNRVCAPPMSNRQRQMVEAASH